jgi:hypothetical protein
VSEPTIKEATKKTFHFPKSATGAARRNKEAAAAPVVKTQTKPALTSKASKAQPVVPVKARPAQATEEVKAKRAKKEKVVRDSFTMPKSDYEKIAGLKNKGLAAGVSVKKSELLRAGLLMLESAAPKRLLAAVSAVEQVKTGRPAKS